MTFTSPLQGGKWDSEEAALVRKGGSTELFSQA